MLPTLDVTTRFPEVKDFDSMVFIEIPERRITVPQVYRIWLIEDVESPWMREFNGNEHYYPHFDFNNESGVGGIFSGFYIMKCKFYRFDGTETGISDDDFRAKRGVLIRDHYNPGAVVISHFIADNLARFLKQRNIEHSRKNFPKRESY